MYYGFAWCLAGAVIMLCDTGATKVGKDINYWYYLVDLLGAVAGI